MVDEPSGRCLLVVGRLLLHPCARPTLRTCATCGRPMCSAHRSTARPSLCLECAREREPVERMDVTLEEMLAFDDAEHAAFEAPTSDEAPDALERVRFDS